MTAIFGVFARQGQSPGDDELQAMAAALPWYGSDGSGQWSGASVALAQLQRQVAPQSCAEQQPQIDASGRFVVVAHARLDYRDELLAKLQLPPAAEPIGDCGLILAAWLRWGVDAVHQLEGDFAFAVWDSLQQTLSCVRDPIGIAPLYLHLSPQRVVFANDLHALLAHPRVPDRLNDAAIALLLSQPHYVMPEMTFFAEVRKLRPARVLVIGPDSVHEQEYWSPASAVPIQLPDAGSYARRLGELLEQAIATRLRSDWPVGAHVSGGLDSSAIALMARQQLQRQGKDLPGFSWLPPPRADEQEAPEYRATRAVEALGLAVEQVELDVVTVLGWLDSDISVNVNTDLYYESLVRAKAAARGVRVLLSGWGGDEVVSSGGRGYVGELFWSGRWRSLKHRLELRSRGSRRPRRNQLRQLFVHALVPLLPVPLRRLLAGQKRVAFARLTGMTATLAAAHPGAPSYAERCPAIGVHRVQRWLLGAGFVQMRIEAWAIQGARDGIEYRYPLLDRRLLEFCLGAPPDLFVHDDYNRALFRAALSPWVPDCIRLVNIKMEETRVRRALDVLEAASRQWLAEVLPGMGEALRRARPYFDGSQMAVAWQAEPLGLMDRLARVMALERQIQLLVMLSRHPARQ